MNIHASSLSDSTKVWFITGASSGFGRALVREAIARGDAVVATARKPESLADLVVLAPDRVFALGLDVTHPTEPQVAVAAALARFGRIDVLVNNAGFSIIGAVEETSEEALRDTLELMFFGAVRLTREVVPHMRERGTGTLVQITSMAGLSTSPGFGAYCAAKHALEGHSECLAHELRPHGVRVLIVEPGVFRTSLFGDAFRRMPEHPAYAQTSGVVRAWVTQTAGQQMGDPHKGARAIVNEVTRPASPDAPLRLPLGGDAVDGIRQKLALIAADVDRTERSARATAF
ncbi:SDR family NAD(P)-dependent oxidoreductase [Myxococcus sp. AM010]|uniref:SDR family NAD(P)-dependent oxidoreductase n=1 Tax=Myxococcus sp. AM010 TaxID=2745138 RepID=UPI001595C98E|nr:SDR family NAD(P)-dependent oxidoreductase [Myxococcus sp. AM010]NVJ17584.1 SDR family NAD(P)-dependent oxidoreductase [Myxococcus sp. AM010]